MDSIGDLLQEARQGKQLTLEDVARATKIKLDILERMEADEFDRLAAPAYTRGFLKLYADYLGLDSRSLVDAYLKSQGGLRRHGLQLETEASARARKPRELQFPMRAVVLAVVGFTAVVLVTLVVKSLVNRPSPAPAAAAAPWPKVEDAYYQPKTHPAPELLDVGKP